MKTKSAKDKGRKLQQYVARRIQELLNLPKEDVVSRPLSSPGADLIMSRTAIIKFPFSLEIKNVKSFPSLSALEQARNNKLDETIPAVCWKPPRKRYDKTIIYFDLEEFLELWREG